MRRLDAVHPETLVEDADRTGYGVAAAKTVRKAERFTVGVTGYVRVLRAAPVVEGDASALVFSGYRLRRRAGFDVAGRGVGALEAALRQRQSDFTEAVVVEIFGNNERLGQDDAHPLELLGRTIQRQGKFVRRRQFGSAADM